MYAEPRRALQVGLQFHRVLGNTRDRSRELPHPWAKGEGSKSDSLLSSRRCSRWPAPKYANQKNCIIWVGVDGIYIPFTYTHATRPPAASSQFRLKWEYTIAPPAVIFSFPFSLPFHPLTVLGPDLLQPERGKSILRMLKLSSRQLCLWSYASC